MIPDQLPAAAQWYAECGLAVFALSPGGKVPRSGSHGYQDATTDLKLISEWWGQNPDANIGLSCGDSGLLVIDVDPRNGGDEALLDLCSRFGREWLETVTALTPGGGEHYYFKYSGLDIRSSASPLGPGIDVKAAGGYVVLPPSRRADGRYVWAEGYSPEERDFANPPAWLVEKLTMRQPRSIEAVALSERIPEGQRNAHMARLAGAMRRQGATAEEIHVALLAMNQLRCDPPLPEQEVRAVAESISRYDPAPDHFIRDFKRSDGRGPANQHQDLLAHNALLAQPQGGPSPGLPAHNALFAQSDTPWPDPPGDAVYRGLPGRLVAAAIPHTEADPVALLVNFLVAFGTEVGTSPHVLVGATRHPARLNGVLVGKTAKARKGDSFTPVRLVFTLASPTWSDRNSSGLSTGEGLIHSVRDAIEKEQPVKEKGKIVGYETVVVDPGVPDKRLLVVEAELARVLKVISRQGNNLSPVIREAWDTGSLRTMTRNSPLRATDAHISILGHITVEELRRELPDVEAANGFANRFMWFAVRRSQLLPNPEPLTEELVAPLAREVGEVIDEASSIGQMYRTKAANDLWVETYESLSQERPGLVGAILARAEAHVLRLSMVYALVDCSPVIDVEHLVAALELWAYTERSVAYVFGDATGDPIADTILAALRASGEMTRTQVYNLFGRHQSSSRITTALTLLLTTGRATQDLVETSGRHAEVWRPL